MSTPVPQRSEIPLEHTWDLVSVFQSDDAWEAEMTQLAADLAEVERFRDRLGHGPTILADWFDTRERLQRRLEKVVLYAYLSHQVDTANQAAAVRNDRAAGFYANALAAMAFAEPEILAVGRDTLRRWQRDEPRLAVYGHYFDRLDHRQTHVRSAEVEELLNQAQGPFESAVGIHGILVDADLRFQPARTAAGEAVELAHGNLVACLASPDRELRRTAWEHHADAYLAVKNTMASCIATLVKQHVFTARARRYSSALEAALAPNHIPVSVFHSLMETYRRHLPTWHRYWKVRRRALGTEDLHPYDIWAPLTANRPSVPFKQAAEWVAQGMRPLGDEYVRIMQRGLGEQRWVDRYPNQGKHAGDHSSGAPGTHPFILMNYTDDVLSMSSLAHELGHSMHSYYAWQTQPFVYFEYADFVAEVASNFNQALVRAYLLDTYDDVDLQIAIVEEAMANFYRYLFVMPNLARFEQEVHERVERGEGLSADDMTALMTGFFREGYGDGVVVDENRVGIAWAQFPGHLALNFYVFQYATGIAAAHALAADVLAGAPGAADRYLAFLRAGDSVYPLDALKLAGVDMTSPAPVEAAFGILAQIVDRLEALTARQR